MGGRGNAALSRAMSLAPARVKDAWRSPARAWRRR